MESLINAVNRAQSEMSPKTANAPVLAPTSIAVPDLPANEAFDVLSSADLKSRHVVSHDVDDKMTRPFDVLRNTCISDLPGDSDVKLMVVASPNAGCGVSTTAANLALSLARLKKGVVVLSGFNGTGLGLRHLLGVADKPTAQTKSGNVRCTIDGLDVHLLDFAPPPSNHGKDAAYSVQGWKEALRRRYGKVTIVLDLPPLLTDDQSGALVTEADMVLLLLAVGQSTKADLENCKSYLHGAKRVQLVLNKARDYDF